MVTTKPELLYTEFTRPGSLMAVTTMDENKSKAGVWPPARDWGSHLKKPSSSRSHSFLAFRNLCCIMLDTESWQQLMAVMMQRYGSDPRAPRNENSYVAFRCQEQYRVSPKLPHSPHALLGGSWVVIRRAKRPPKWIVTLRITPLTSTHEPPSRS